jgi:PEP-CTERM motif
VKKWPLVLSAMVVALAPVSALADTCVGACGSLGANGVVTLSPAGNPAYQYVTTNGGLSGVGQIDGVGGNNGSTLTTSVFGSNAGDELDFYFNYVTSDGAEFADYAWAELQTDAAVHVAWLFTARTEPSGDTSPGVGLPTNDSTLDPISSAIIAGGPAWSPLGGSSGQCFDAGCGYTGWIKSVYNIADAGNYKLVFGVTNFLDGLYDSGLAFDGATIGGVPIGGDVPEPASMGLVGLGVAGLLWARRRKLAA